MQGIDYLIILPDEIVQLTIGNSYIDATINHPFWVEDYGFKPAGDLETGDVVVTASGEYVQVSDAEIEYLDEPVAVYNFEVMDWGTYYVSGMEVLVHNKCFDETSYEKSSVKIQVSGRTGQFQRMVVELESQYGYMYTDWIDGGTLNEV